MKRDPEARYNTPTGKTLRDAGLRPKKSLGQNFLTDRTVPPRIAAAAQIGGDDLIVEVGPGLGVLTEELADMLDPHSGKLIAVELDDNLVPVLEQRFAARDYVSILHEDILKVDTDNLTGGRSYKVVANLPYYITSAVLRHFLEASHKPTSLTVMVQREVAERMVAGPPDMSLLAVSVQYYGDPKLAFRVPAGAFHPVPKVESAVVHIRVYGEGERPVMPESDRTFFRVARAGFSQKRKQLGNTLSSDLHIPKDRAVQGLKEGGVDPARRAETLAIQEWGKLEQIFREELNKVGSEPDEEEK